MRNFIENREKRYADVPENLGSERCQQKIDAILDNPDGYKVLDEYNHNDVRQTLKRHFGINCVYCESSPIASSTFRIDHYRPKKGIKDVSETGYYWLAYEWSNLMQSCQLCNGTKSNYFPLKATSKRVTDATPNATDEAFRKPDIAPLNTEERLLLNPELDEVEKHFTFKANGIIESDTDEGKTSITRYDLLRDELVFWRKTVRDTLLRKLKRAIDDYENDKKISLANAKSALFGVLKSEFRELLWAYNNKAQYSLFNLFIFDKFDEFIINEFYVQEHKDLLHEAWRLRKLNQL